jgi:RepB DNA-primase from phage plasmid/CHC2 zinc finger
MNDHAGDLDRYLRILAGESPTGRLIEIRSATPHGGMRQTFTPATRPDLAARAIIRLASNTDVYVGVLLRHRRAGGRQACERSHLAFVEIDRRDALERLAQYRYPPSMVIASAGAPGHAHAYWQLQQPVELDELEQANRRLAIRLGGDLASVDAARILRPPTSWNRKHTPPTRVELLVLHLARRYQLAELTDGLTDPSPPRRSIPPCNREATSELDRQLLAIPATTYVPALTGRQPNRAGKIVCPFHDDTRPSLQLYDHGWYCFACRVGGSIYDFGAILFGLDTRGHEFLQLRQRLATELWASSQFPK